MTAHLMAQAAYGAAKQAALKTPRNVEYDIFAQVTARLRAAEAAGKPAFPALVAALHDNRQLWTTLAADVAESDNRLPEALRAKLFYLARFTQDHSRKVLAGQDSAGVLVEINMAVMRGLATQGQAA
ncbi:flagellar biosynthesis regulator FlaF [Actibacterium sp.]|uniref:flagellar biosynthesis regulator FlaF n=1 Tax=Actibacterium sp. TaxID=1872125 RepID=UPI00356588D8